MNSEYKPSPAEKGGTIHSLRELEWMRRIGRMSDKNSITRNVRLNLNENGGSKPPPYKIKKSFCILHFALHLCSEVLMTYVFSPNNIPEVFSLHGVRRDLKRMPLDAAAAVSEAVLGLVKCPAGGRIRFKTDSSCVRIGADFREGNVNSASDVLCDGAFLGRVGPYGFEHEADCLDGEVELPSDGKLHSITVFLPRTVELLEYRITLDDGAALEAAEPYNITKPIVFYGSSITMGAISTSPSHAYTALVAERLGVDHINLGFGGSAKGERAMAEYIAGLEMSAFVLDYEHNAPTLDHLRETHRPFFDIIREAQPDLPILIVSRPDTDGDRIRVFRGRQIIMDTFHHALDKGDLAVDFVDGSFLWGNDDREICHYPDDPHPTDEGFRRMADVIAPRLRRIMESAGVTGLREPDGRDDGYLKRL